MTVEVRSEIERQVHLVPDGNQVHPRAMNSIPPISSTRPYTDDPDQCAPQLRSGGVFALEGTVGTSICLVAKRRVTSVAWSDDISRTVDRIQSEAGEGPCIDGLEENEVFETGDLATEERWPNFSTRVHVETGIRSMLFLRLFVGENTIGTLNLYSTASDAFADSDIALGSIFAAHAAVAMQAARRGAQLEHKANSRDVISRAKGILMARSGVDDARAFQLLKAASQRMNMKVRDVAEHIAEGKPLSEGTG